MNAASTGSRYHVFIVSRKKFKSMARFWVVLICKICYTPHYSKYKNKVCSRQLSFYYNRYYIHKFFRKCLIFVISKQYLLMHKTAFCATLKPASNSYYHFYSLASPISRVFTSFTFINSIPFSKCAFQRKLRYGRRKKYGIEMLVNFGAILGC